VLWLVYRPSIRIRPLLVAGAVVLAVWFPYLRFEAPRHFLDIRSQLLLYPIFPADLTQAWCKPRLVLHTARTPPARSLQATGSTGATAASTKPLLTRAKQAVDERLLANFPQTRIPGARWALMMMVLAALVAFGAGQTPDETTGSSRGRRRHRLLIPAAAVVGGACLALRSVVVSNSLVRTSTTLLAAAAIAFLAVRLIPPAVRLLAARLRMRLPSDRWAARRRLVVIGLAVPWFLLLVVAEPGRPERFFWLWPMQVLFLAAFATVILPRLPVPRVGVWLVQGLLVFLLLDNSFLTSRVDAWRAQGWSGREANEVRVVDYLAARVADKNSNRAAIGYRVFIYPFMATYNKINPQYKVGADLDLLFRYRRGITNTDKCAEGFSPTDEYRIVRTTPASETDAPRQYFVAPLDEFRLLRRFGPYEVFRRV